MLRTVCTSAALVLAALASAQSGVYYLSAPTQNVDFRAQAGAVIGSWTQGVTGESAIAVASDIRSIGVEGGFQGSRYTLLGVDTGQRFSNPVSGSLLYDGTSDGTNNYTIDFVSHTVYRTSNTWTSPAALFTAPGTNGYLGITYDATNGSLWLSSWSAGVLEDRTLGGALISSFTTPFSSITCLAMDGSDNTLWMGSQSTPGVFYHYSRAGASLGQVSYAGVSQNTLGGEFAAVPEPGSWFAVLAGLSLLWSAATRRRFVLRGLPR
jgi:hypothetical protein